MGPQAARQAYNFLRPALRCQPAEFASARVQRHRRTRCINTSSCSRFPACASGTCRRCRTSAGWRWAAATRRSCPSFPAVTCPVQANMTTGKLPREHGVVANGFYWRDQRRVEMWTSWNDCIERPQIWDLLHDRDRSITSAVWFALHSKGCGADYICTPAPIHNPDGSESLWCYTRPEMIYGELRDEARPFSAAAFLGPAGRHSVDGLDRRLGRPHGAEIPPEFLLHLSAAPRLRRAKGGARQHRRPHSARRARRGNRQAGRRLRARLPTNRRSGSWPASTRSCRSNTSSIPTACSARRGC